MEIVKTVKSCPICGCELVWGPKGKGGGPQSDSPTLDRINNGQIITENTIQIICNQCNATKGARTAQEMLGYCKMYIENYEYTEAKLTEEQRVAFARALFQKHHQPST